MPFSTSCGSRHGRPPLGDVPRRSRPGTNRLMATHCSSVRSTAKYKHDATPMEIGAETWSDVDHMERGAVMRCALADRSGPRVAEPHADRPEDIVARRLRLGDGEGALVEN